MIRSSKCFLVWPNSIPIDRPSWSELHSMSSPQFVCELKPAALTPKIHKAISFVFLRSLTQSSLSLAKGTHTLSIASSSQSSMKYKQLDEKKGSVCVLDHSVGHTVFTCFTLFAINKEKAKVKQVKYTITTMTIVENQFIDKSINWSISWNCKAKHNFSW